MTTQPPVDASIRNVLQRAGFSAEDLASGNLLCPRPPKTDVMGRWVWLPDPAGRDWRNCYAYFRRTFTAAGELTLHIAADTTYELHLDGALVDRGTAPAEVSYKTFDTHRLKVGPAGTCWRFWCTISASNAPRPCARGRACGWK